VVARSARLPSPRSLATLRDDNRGVTTEPLDGKYRLVRLLGRGGMGAVHEAEHLGTGRTVAIKTILPALLESSAALERFRREARAAGRLRHPNIVDVTDFGVAHCEGSEVAYLAMEYLEGMTLQSLIRSRGALPVDLVVAIIEQIALALQAAHAAGVVHRDLKPENVWLVPNALGGYAVRVLDFGIAKLRDAAEEPRVNAEIDREIEDRAIDADAATIEMRARSSMQESTEPLTLAGTTVGTPAYMSPEQCRSASTDARSDIYSLGVIAYEMLSGRRPFVAETLREMITAHLEKTPPRLDAIAPVSPRVAAVVAKALAKSPDDRFQSATAMAGSLYAAAEGPAVIVRRAAALYIDRLPSFLRVSWSASIPGLAVLFMIALVAAFSPIAVAYPLVFLGSGFAWGMVAFLSNASFAVVIDELRKRPLEDVTASDVSRGLRVRLGLDPRTSWLRTIRTLWWFYLRAELKCRAGEGDLAFLIAFLESRPSNVQERCEMLARSSKRTYNWVRGAIFAVVFVPLVIESALIYVIASQLGAKNPGDVAALVGVSLAPVNAFFFNPIFSSALALLYFRARQANGEDVGLAAVVPGRL